MKKAFLPLFLIFGIFSTSFAADNTTDVYLLAQSNSAEELKKIENIDIVDSDGNTALCFAIKYDDINAYNILKQAGANTEHQCVNKIPAKQIQAFTQKLAATNKSWSFLGLGKWTWAAIGAGIVAGGGVAAMGSGGGGSDNDTSSECASGDCFVLSPSPSCESQGYTLREWDSCPDGYVKSLFSCRNNGEESDNWYMCEPRECLAPFFISCPYGWQNDESGETCLSGTTVYRHCSPVTCEGYQSYCDYGYRPTIGDTCQSGNNTLVKCEFDDDNFIIEENTIYSKINCIHGIQDRFECSCNPGWTGALCDTMVNCDGFSETSCGTGYLITDTCRSGDTDYVQCTFDSEHYIEQGGIAYEKLNCNHGTQDTNTCSCNPGWTGALCDTMVNCDGFSETSCDTGYMITDTCRSGDTDYVQCEFDSEHYIEINNTIYEKLNCNNGTQVGDGCYCNEGWKGEFCNQEKECAYHTTECVSGFHATGEQCHSGDNTYVQCEPDACEGYEYTDSTPCDEGYVKSSSCLSGTTMKYMCDGLVQCPYTTTECTGAYRGTGRTCKSGAITYVECTHITCPQNQAWTPDGCVAQTNAGIDNTSSTSPIVIRNNVPNADNVSSNTTVRNLASSKVKAVFSGTPGKSAINVISTSHNGTVTPNEYITGNVTITLNTTNVNGSGSSEVYGVFGDNSAPGAINVYYDRANLNNHALELSGSVTITDYDNAGEVAGVNGGYAYNLYVMQNGEGEIWESAKLNAKIQINNYGNKPVYGMKGFQLLNGYSNHEILTTSVNPSTGTNSYSGSISITNAGSGNAYGMYLKPTSPGTNFAINAHNADGYIQINNSGSGNAYGMYGPKLINMDTPNTTNPVTGIIYLSNSAGGNIYGMYGSEIHNETFGDYNNYISYTNSWGYDVWNKDGGPVSRIRLENNGTGHAVGIYVEQNGIATNSGRIEIANKSTGTAFGIFGDTGSTITNSGLILITYPFASGTIIGDVFGIYAKSGSTVNNSGLIRITTNGNAYGIYTEPNSYVTNTGTISINSDSCSGSACYTGNHIVLNGSTLYNSGVIAAPQMNLNAMSGNVVAGPGSQFIVQNALSGDLNISSALVTNGNQTTYIAPNMIDAGDVSELNVLSESAMFNASLADNGHDVVMQMKDFNELTDNKSLAAFLKNNYDNGNGAELFSTLKSMDNISAFNGTLSGLTGLNTFTQFAHEDLSAMREISFSMNNKLFENSDRDNFDISDSMGYFSFSDSHNGGSGQYGISSNKISDNWKFGYGMAMANINTGDGNDMHRQNKLWLFYMPATYTNDDIELVIAPKAGFAHSEYNRRGYNNINYEGYIEKTIFGLMNDLRYPLTFGNWTIAPDLAFNTIVYSQNGQEDEQEFSLVIPDDRTVSVETGLGFYTKYEKAFSDGARLKLNSGLMLYREFGDTYDIKLGMRGMDGTFSLYNNDYTYRGAASLGFDYTSGRLHLYGNTQYFMDNANYMNFKGGISYRF